MMNNYLHLMSLNALFSTLVINDKYKMRFSLSSCFILEHMGDSAYFKILTVRHSSCSATIMMISSHTLAASTVYQWPFCFHSNSTYVQPSVVTINRILTGFLHARVDNG